MNLNLLPLNEVRIGEIEDLFGCTLSAKQILSLYSCDTGTFKKEDYDIHRAYNLQIENVPFIVWGKSIRIIAEPLRFANKD